MRPTWPRYNGFPSGSRPLAVFLSPLRLAFMKKLDGVVSADHWISAVLFLVLGSRSVSFSVLFLVGSGAFVAVVCSHPVFALSVPAAVGRTCPSGGAENHSSLERPPRRLTPPLGPSLSTRTGSADSTICFPLNSIDGPLRVPSAIRASSSWLLLLLLLLLLLSLSLLLLLLLLLLLYRA